ncbi:hypothetical protein SASPL_133899 [Salvia splendens]|uniref:Uncharacterized protein n=1 Tax=Salvia splendens TaxID=180675 RepID=A0A8X8X546_SALSN|nr:hypothetical protein SASPL_133899 [Salvia splendens]
MSLITDEIRAAASEMYRGDDICQEKSKFLLTEMGLPNGLLPLRDIIEYGAEVTAYVEQKRIKKLTGVKAKEMLMWLTICDIYVDDPPTGKITFKSPTGLSRSFPVNAFVIEDDSATIKPEPAAAAVVQVKEV